MNNIENKNSVSADTLHTHTHTGTSFNELLNKITLGDSYELIKQIPDDSIDLVIMDPPYEFDTGSGAGAFGTKRRNYRKEYISLYHEKGKSTKDTERLRISANKERQRQQLNHISNGFELEILDELVRVMKKINIYIWCSKKQVSKILHYFENINCSTDILTWHKTKPTPTINNSYLPDTEYCIYARENGAYLGGEYETKHKFYITTANKSDKDKFKHPTIKPINIIKNLIINSSKENEIIFDPFSGSGTTCVAAKELNRQYVGIEIDPEYHKISVDRLEGILANGQTSMFMS